MAKKTKMDGNSDFLSRIAHDMRSPLATIAAFLQIARPKGGHEVLQELHEAALISLEKLNKMADQLRTPISIKQPQYQWIDVASLIQTAVKELTPFAAKRKAEMIYAGPEQLLCYVDGQLIDRVIGNLIVNALQAVHEKNGGLVRIALFLSEQTVFVEVGDNGSGISPQHLIKIFDPGFTHGKKDGTGIGLDTCKQIMNGHQGEIKVYSIPKQGTVFTGSIPQPSEIHHVNNDIGVMLATVREDTLD